MSFFPATPRSKTRTALLAHRAVNPPTSSSLAEERTPPLAPSPRGGARSRRSQRLHHQCAAQHGGWVAGTRLAGEARTPRFLPGYAED